MTTIAFPVGGQGLHPRRMILENVWGPGYVRELHYLRVYAYRIRRKLGDERGELPQSDPAVGYRLALPVD